MSNQNNEFLVSDEFSLDFHHPYQLVQDEELVYSKAKGVFDDEKYHEFSMMPFRHNGIVKGSVYGVISLDGFNSGYFSFVDNSHCNSRLHCHGTPLIDVKIDYETRRITLHWSQLVNPYDVKVLVSYEYDYVESKNNDYLPKQIQQVIIE